MFLLFAWKYTWASCRLCFNWIILSIISAPGSETITKSCEICYSFMTEEWVSTLYTRWDPWEQCSFNLNKASCIPPGAAGLFLILRDWPCLLLFFANSAVHLQQLLSKSWNLLCTNSILDSFFAPYCVFLSALFFYLWYCKCLCGSLQFFLGTGETY